jgi:hypothetical protein
VKVPERLLPCKTATAVAFLLFCSFGTAQQSSPAAAPEEMPSMREVALELRELRAEMEQMRAENAQSRAEMEQLRRELRETRTLLSSAVSDNGGAPAPASAVENTGAPPSSTPSSPVSDLDARVQRLEDSTQLLGSKINEQYQTKVETAGKYRARLSGIVLMNAFHNVGASDNLDLPDYAVPAAVGTSQSSFGATLRQSEIGLEIFGPMVAGAKTSANVQFDFFGGFPATNNGVNFGVARLQTGSLRLDWKQTSVVAGQDTLFFSPLSPTSFASLAVPAFGNAGNLWGWTPQLRVEHRFDLGDQQAITFQGGILDNLDWETPANQYFRSATAGESTGQPAYAMRTSWLKPVFDHPLSFGVAGYYGRQDWAWSRFVDAWAGTADWQIPIVRRLGLSGEFYRGRGVGGLGGAIGQTIVWGGNPTDPYTPIRGLNSSGGWTQLKLQLTSKLELNAVFAEDDAFTADIRGFATDANNGGSILGRNKGALGNFVFRPRSDLVLSAEFRRLHTFPVYDPASVTNQVNLAMGVLF